MASKLEFPSLMPERRRFYLGMVEVARLNESGSRCAKLLVRALMVSRELRY